MERRSEACQEEEDMSTSDTWKRESTRDERRGEKRAFSVDPLCKSNVKERAESEVVS